ncbi:cytochrome c-type biogenesis protein CcmH [Bacillus sp. B15-48]|uniref:cytochrome c-type biogenesis protein n=1 Tax=Bacillus sp. B15-48 TaxID=1548601 RepID=UPI00193F355C|nr:cytochrome c-type biogenesis protein CcmH [Bacillus sp. B15-48]
MVKKVVLTTLILLIGIPNLSLAAFTENSKEFQNVIKQLDMQGHADKDLSTCPIQPIYRKEVLEMLNNGMTEEEILQSYVDEYGQAALRAPATDKSGWIAWGMPFAGLTAGGAIVAVWLRKMKNRDELKQTPHEVKWESELEREIAEKVFDEERRKHF